jgi:hypothetical protein
MGEFPNKSTQFKKGNNENPTGRPKKSFSMLNQQLKDEGYEVLTRNQIIEAYSLIFSLDEAKIKQIASDKEQPLVIRLIIKELANADTGGKAIQDIRNYIFGQSKQEVEHSGQLKVETVTLFELPKNGRDEGS